MESSDNSLISDEVLGIVIVAIFIFVGIGLAIKYFFDNVLPQFLIDLTSFWNSYYIWIIGIISFVFLLTFIYIFYKLVVFRREKLKEKLRREIIIEKKREEIEELLENKTEELRSRELIELRNKLIEAKKGFVGYEELESGVKRIDGIIYEIFKKLPKEQEKEEVDELLQRKRRLELAIEELGKEEYRRSLALEENKRLISEKLNTAEKTVFKIKGRTKKELEVLKGEKYKTANEYCVYESKVIPVLVRKVMGHTRTHVFLVWSVEKLLKSIPGIVNIKEHDTRDADLTFEYIGKKYAIEVETGSLTKKPRHMADKKSYLDKKYGKRWFVVISNRNLLSKYKNFGIITTRKTALENLNKMLKI